MLDLFEPFGQNVEHESPDEFHSTKGHLLQGIIFSTVSPGKYYFAVFKRFDAVV